MRWQADAKFIDQKDNMATDDGELIKCAQQGSEKALAALIARHQRYVYNLAFRMLGDVHEAQDLTQEAFLRMWRGLDRFRGDAKFTTWLYRIVVNLCCSRLPELRRQLATADIDETDPYALPAVAAPPGMVEEAEQHALLHQQIAALPEKYRLVITLFYLQEQNYQEIAQVLSLPVNTVKTHLFRARERLKQSLIAGGQTGC